MGDKHLPAKKMLIGLGGLGSRIIDEVYGRIPDYERKNLFIHAFDTDVNDIKELKNISADDITQTSTEDQVGETIDFLEKKGDKTIRDWIQCEIKEINDKLLTTGAGQIRTVSRLALQRVMMDDDIKNNFKVIDSKIDEFLKVSSEKYIQDISITIISSLAGGTGSGIFLQIALYLHEIFNTKKISNTCFKGIFVLPDIFTRTGELETNDPSMIQAIAYASMKELNGILAITSGKDPNTPNLELKYHPSRHVSSTITSQTRLFDRCYFFDYENTKGKPLSSSFDDYLDQIIDCIVMQVFSPATGAAFSDEDNLIIKHIKDDTHGKIGACAVSRLVYPFENIVSQLSWRVTHSLLDDYWLEIDRLFERELEEYKIKEGKDIIPDYPEPELRTGYLKHLAAKSANNDKYFTKIYYSIQITGKDGNIICSKAKSYLEKIEESIENRINKLDSYKKYLKNFENMTAKYIDKKNYFKIKNNKRNAHAEIQNMEDNLVKFSKDKDTISEHFKTILDDEIFSCNDKIGAGLDIRRWLLDDKHYSLHPVAVRAFLYDLSNLVDNNKKIYKSEVDEYKIAINDYFEKAYDLPETPNHIEKLPEAIAKYKEGRDFLWIKKGIISFLFTKYLPKSKIQFENIKNYIKLNAKLQTLESISEKLEKFIKIWEDLFTNLRKDNYISLKTLTTNQINLINETENETNPTISYVLSSVEDRDKLMKELNIKAIEEKITTDVFQEISKSNYTSFIEKLDPNDSNKCNHKINFCNTIKSIFEYVKAYLRKSDSINIDIIKALKKEAHFRGKDENEHLKDRIGSLSDLATPWITKSGKGKISFFCIYKAQKDSLGIRNSINNPSLFNQIFTNPVEDHLFSDKEIAFYRAYYLIKLADLRKFSSKVEGEGACYYNAYKETIDKLNKYPDKTTTPHLDKRWHLPIYIPDINPEIAKKNQKDIKRAFLLGVIYNVLKWVDGDKWVYDEPYMSDSGKEIMSGLKDIVDNKNYKSKNIRDLYINLGYNPSIVYSIIDKTTKIRDIENDKKIEGEVPPKKREIEKHPFYENMFKLKYMEKNILDILLQEALDEINPDAEFANLIPILAEEIENLYFSYYSVRSKIVMEKIEKCFKELVDESEMFLEYSEDDDKRNSERFIICNRFIEGYLENLRNRIDS